MRKVILCEYEKCTGCQICELVCSIIKENEINPALSRIHLTGFDPSVMMSFGCQFCEKPSCVNSCPRRALRVTEKGIIEINSDRCTLCGWCIQPASCPFGAIAIFRSSITVCDLCDGKPKCVEYCPTDALHFATRNEMAGHIRRDAVRRRALAGNEVVRCLQHF